MGDRFQHTWHVMRVGAVLGVGLAVFVVARWALIPSDFGVLGYYRAGALDENKTLPIVHAGRTACMECHDGTYDPPEPDEEAPARTLALTKTLDPATDNRHYKLNCEACHGPLQKHVADEDKEMAVPKVGSDALCLGCHRTLAGRPQSQPQVVPADHKKSGDPTKDACVACHKPHWPKAPGEERPVKASKSE